MKACGVVDAVGPAGGGRSTEDDTRENDPRTLHIDLISSLLRPLSEKEPAGGGLHPGRPTARVGPGGADRRVHFRQRSRPDGVDACSRVRASGQVFPGCMSAGPAPRAARPAQYKGVRRRLKRQGEQRTAQREGPYPKAAGKAWDETLHPLKGAKGEGQKRVGRQRKKTLRLTPGKVAKGLERMIQPTVGVGVTA